MPITKLDDKTVLIIIDLQKGIVGLPLAHPAHEIIDRSAQLARAFRARNRPIVLVNVTGGAPGRTDAGAPKFSFPPDWAELIPELEQQPSDLLITKQCWGAFLGTALHDELRQRGITQVVLTGIATSIGVESTARSAYELGYNVTLVLDAMTDRDVQTHQYCAEKIFPRLGETGNASDVLKLLA